MRELVVGEGECPTNLLEAARTFAKVACLEQCEHVRFMATYVDARKELEALWSGKACRSRRPRQRGKGRRG